MTIRGGSSDGRDRSFFAVLQTGKAGLRNPVYPEPAYLGAF